MREVLVMLALATLLMMLLVMWVARARPGSRRNLCELRQQEVAAALLQWESLHGHFPGYVNEQAVDAQGERQPASWVFATLPYLGYDLEPFTCDGTVNYRAAAESPEVSRPYRSLVADHGPSGAAVTRGTAPQQRLVEFICPDDSDRSQGNSVNPLSWVVNTGMPDAESFADESPSDLPESSKVPADWEANGVFFDQFTPGASPKELVGVGFLQDHDGLNTTLLLSESVAAGKWTFTREDEVGFAWAANLDESGEPTPLPDVLPINGEETRAEFKSAYYFRLPSSHHSGGSNAVFAGGKTQFISEGIDYLVLTRLMTSHGEAAKLPGKDEPVPEPY